MIRLRNKFISIIPALTLALGLSACASLSTPEVTSTPTATHTPEPPTATPEPMALTVNGEGITVLEFDSEVERYIAAQTALGINVDELTAASAVIDDLVAQLLLGQAARADGFTLDEAALQARIDSLAAEIGGAENLTKWQSDHGYSDQVFRSALKRGMESAWMRDKIISAVPSTAEQVHVQQILAYNEEGALEALEQLNSGVDFDELAASPFFDPVTRGDLGWFPRGYLLEKKIEDAAFSLEVGDYSGVIATDVGFHILKILARDPARPLSPDALLAMQEQTLRVWIEEQRLSAEIVLAPP